MFPLILCSIAVVGIVVERWLALRRKNTVPADLGAKVRDWARAPRIEAEHLKVLKENSALGAVLAAGIALKGKPREHIKDAMESAGRTQLSFMERHIDWLGMISNVSPFIGLLGTVFGMIDTFTAIGKHGVGDSQVMAGGIAQALIATAAGLVVAIPAAFAYHYLRNRVDRLGAELEKEGAELIAVLDSSPVPMVAPVKR
jgi:biopolymer transport protein ExbB